MYIKRYYEINKKIIYVYLLLIILGNLFGVIAFSKINNEEKKEIASLYKNSILVVKEENKDNSKIFYKILDNNIKTVIGIILMGLCVFGKYGILLNGFVIGFKIGINNSVLYHVLLDVIWKKYILLYIIVYILYIICYTIISILNYKFSENLSRLIEEENKRENLIRFIIYNLIISLMMIIPIVFESGILQKIIKNSINSF